MEHSNLQHYADYKAYGRSLVERVVKYGTEDVSYLESSTHKQSEARPYKVVRKGVVRILERRIHGCPIHMLRAETIVSAPAAVIMDWMCEPDFLRQLDPGCVGAKKELKRFDDANEVSYYVYGGTGPIAKRDFVTFESNAKMSDELYITSACSVEFAGMPAQKDLVRGKIWTSGYILAQQPDGHTTHVTYIMHGSPEGYIPAAIVNLAQSRSPFFTMSRIRERFMKGAPGGPRAGSATSTATPTTIPTAATSCTLQQDTTTSTTPSTSPRTQDTEINKGSVFTDLFEELMKHPVMMERIMSLEAIKRLLRDSATFNRVLDNFKMMRESSNGSGASEQMELFDDPQQLRDMLDLIITEKLPLEELNDFLKELFGLNDDIGASSKGKSLYEYEKKHRVEALVGNVDAIERADTDATLDVSGNASVGAGGSENASDSSAAVVDVQMVYFKVAESHILYSGERNIVSEPASVISSPKLSFSTLKAALTNGNTAHTHNNETEHSASTTSTNGHTTTAHHSMTNGNGHAPSLLPFKPRPARAFPVTPNQLNVLNNLSITGSSSVQQWHCSFHRDEGHKKSVETWALHVAQRLKKAWRQLVRNHPALRVVLLKEASKADAAASEVPMESEASTWWQVLPGTQAKLYWKEADWSAMNQSDRAEAWALLLSDDVARDFVAIKASSLLRFHVINYTATELRFVLSFHSALMSPVAAYNLLKRAFAAALDGVDIGLRLSAGLSMATLLACDSSTSTSIVSTVPKEQPVMDKSEQLAYWKKTLADFSAPTTLFKCKPLRNTDLKRKKGSNINSKKIEFSLETISALQAAAEKEGTSLYAILLSAWSFMLSRCSGGEKKVMFGVSRLSHAHASRPIPTLPVLINLADETTEHQTAPKLLQLWPFLRAAAQHTDLLNKLAMGSDCCSLDQIQKQSEVPGDYRLFNSLFVFDDVTLDLSASLVARPTSSTVRVVIDENQHTLPVWDYPLVLSVRTSASDATRMPEFSLAFDTANFSERSATRITQYYKALVEGIAVASAEQVVHYLPMLPRSEQEELVVAINSNWAPYVRDRRVESLFEDQVRRVPNRVAIEFEGQKLTYKELDGRINQMAHWFVEHGIHGKGSVVALYMTRDFSLVVSMFAVMKIGASYLPLDPRTPRERVFVICEDATVNCIVTDYDKSLYLFAESEPASTVKPVVLCVDRSEDRADLAKRPVTPIPASITEGLISEDRIYIIYTSGSTGKPKGVQICHRGLINQFTYIAKNPGMSEADTILGVSTISFDIAQLELVQPLTMGARIIMVSAEVQRDGHLLRGVLESNSSKSSTSQKLTILQATPASWRMLCAAGWEGDPSILRLWCGGEAMTCDLAKQLIPRCCALYNMYGPTETTVWGSAIHVSPQLLTESSTVPVGIGVDNSQFFILDSHRQLVPKGVVGELYIAGDGVGSYVDKALTNSMYVDNLFKNWPGLAGRTSERMFRVGDVLRCRDNDDEVAGQRAPDFEFLGRVDHQVKIRGYRIELEEIINLLYTNTSVGECLVVAKQPTYEGGEKYLVAYIILKKQPASTCTVTVEGRTEKDPSLAEIAASVAAKKPSSSDQEAREKEKERRQLAYNLRLMLEDKLPPYMVPSYFVVLDKWPLSPNGKIDRAALPLPQRTKHETYVAARNETEMKLIEAFEEVLQISPVGLEDDFFELGGNSLLGVSLVGAIEAKFGVQFPFSVIFQASNARLLATCIENAQQGSSTSTTPTAPLAVTPCPPVASKASSTESVVSLPPKPDLVNKMLADKLLTALESPVVGLQTKGTRTPLYFIHPAFRSSVCYGALSYYLGEDQPFYGLEPRTEYKTIEEMAEGYLQAIIAHRPAGPYWIGGWSFGCTVAYEVARRLQEMGKQTLLIMLDGRAPLYEDEGEIDLGALVMCMLCRGAKQFLGFSVEVAYPEIRPMTPDERLMHVAEKVLQKDGLNNVSPAVAGSFFFRFQKEIRESEQMCRDYKPPRSALYKGDIVLFRSIHALPIHGFADPLLDTRTLGWDRFIANTAAAATTTTTTAHNTGTSGQVRVVDTDSDHESVVFQPAVQDVARKLRSCLDAASAAQHQTAPLSAPATTAVVTATHQQQRT
eukprot:TRINITY_DN5622_c0_g1_i3.p1 TRINITY_DN5622_c0_g1~~TRINITY_DN5622_c0_g1_i3.p1  ORF type:complete len:2096 (+),score=364.38 TRINITY_DN5622_c0_g1_i3:217-6504(+)